MSAVAKQFLHVRNPRNLERMRIAWRATGYGLDKDKDFRMFTYKIQFEKGTNHLAGHLVHFHEGRILSVSSQEPALMKRLYRPGDVSAAENVGRILARRCLQAGIQFANRGVTEEESTKSEKVAAFYKGIQDGGLILQEQDVIQNYPHWEYPEPDYGKELEEDVIVQAAAVGEKPQKKKSKAKPADKPEATDS